jgi:hypothetical protein
VCDGGDEHVTYLEMLENVEKIATNVKESNDFSRRFLSSIRMGEYRDQLSDYQFRWT